MKNLHKALAISLFTLVISACQNTEQSNEQTTRSRSEATQAVNSDAISFTLTNLQGEPVQASDYRGKWLVLNYWATWCGPCRDEMPELIKFQSNNPDVQILGIAYEDSEIEKLQNFVNDFDINYPILTIDVYNPPAFAEEGGLGLPTTIVYDKEGNKHEKHMGPIDYDGLMSMVGKSAE
ncbi:TlpA family protein disulfide reductase [Marinicella rhabdoformis]|uniref:TlpA family protein disulfide reductase n=1 Tax=Marinicella rhabdoformis TaxID=2580566 RepID=UPI0012AEBDEC|nr:TlpA disulfide reductase family protein [Marinicella rhabdoformis]